MSETIEFRKRFEAPPQPKVEEICERIKLQIELVASVSHGAVLSDAAFSALRVSQLQLNKLMEEQA